MYETVVFSIPYMALSGCSLLWRTCTRKFHNLHISYVFKSQSLNGCGEWPLKMFHQGKIGPFLAGSGYLCPESRPILKRLTSWASSPPWVLLSQAATTTNCHSSSSALHGWENLGKGWTWCCIPRPLLLPLVRQKTSLEVAGMAHYTLVIAEWIDTSGSAVGIALEVIDVLACYSCF